MLKKNKGLLALTTFITALPILIGLLLWDRLPDSIPTHFDINGVPDSWSGKAFAVLGIPAFMVAIHLLCSVITLADPNKQNIQEKVFRLILWICPFVSVLLCVTTYPYAMGVEFNTTRIATLFLGFLFLIIGNYLPKCKQNYTVGIKLPWTLADADNWERTHRLAGRIWVLGGILIAGSTFLENLGLVVVFTCFAVMVLVPTAYSFLHYLKHKNEN